MEASVAHEKMTEDSFGFFLAGHQAPAGNYREIHTGREVRMEEADVLPATCDGHVAVYVRRPLTWAEICRPGTC